MKSHSTLSILSILFILLALASCKREQLYDETSNLVMEIAIDYEIKHTPDLPEPETMFVGFYDPATGELQRTEYTGPRGGEVFVDAGCYDIMTYNFDTEATLIRDNGNINTAEAYTNVVSEQVRSAYRAMLHKIKEKRPAPLRVQEYEDQPVINEPDHLFAGVDRNTSVPVRGNSAQTFVIHAEASTMLETYALSIGPIKGLEYIAQAEVFITGQVQAKLIATRQVAGVPSTLYIPLEIGKRSRSEMLNATFRTFGKYPEADNKVYMVTKLTDYYGNVTLIEADVTEQFDDPGNTDSSITIDEAITIDPPTTGTGGLAPSVTLWEEKIISILI